METDPRRRALLAAVSALGLSLGVSIPAHAADDESPKENRYAKPQAQLIKGESRQMKYRANSAHIKGESHQIKIEGRQIKIGGRQLKGESHQLKIEGVQAKTMNKTSPH